MQADHGISGRPDPGTTCDGAAAQESRGDTSDRGLRRRPEEVLTSSRAARTTVAVVVVLLAVTAAVATRWAPLIDVDKSVAAWAYDLASRNPGAGSWWAVVDRYTEPILLRIGMVLLAGFLAWRRRWALAGWLVAVAVVENFAAPYSKYVLDRPRPQWPHPLVVEHTTSYPAGHPAGVATFAIAIVLVALVTLSSDAARRAVIAAALLLVTVICLDRIFLGLHYLSDVVGGLLLGAAVPILGWTVMLRLVSNDEG